MGVAEVRGVLQGPRREAAGHHAVDDHRLRHIAPAVVRLRAPARPARRRRVRLQEHNRRAAPARPDPAQDPRCRRHRPVFGGRTRLPGPERDDTRRRADAGRDDGCRRRRQQRGLRGRTATGAGTDARGRRARRTDRSVAVVPGRSGPDDSSRRDDRNHRAAARQRGRVLLARAG